MNALCVHQISFSLSLSSLDLLIINNECDMCIDVQMFDIMEWNLTFVLILMTNYLITDLTRMMMINTAVDLATINFKVQYHSIVNLYKFPFAD